MPCGLRRAWREVRYGAIMDSGRLEIRVRTTYRRTPGLYPLCEDLYAFGTLTWGRKWKELRQPIEHDLK